MLVEWMQRRPLMCATLVASLVVGPSLLQAADDLGDLDDLSQSLGTVGNVETSVLNRPMRVALIKSSDDRVALDSTLQPVTAESAPADDEPTAAVEPTLAAPANSATPLTQAESTEPVEPLGELVPVEPADMAVEVTDPAKPAADDLATSSGDMSAKPDVADTYAAHAKPEPSLFHGMQPGVSTRQQLLAQWGAAAQTTATEGGELFSYTMSPFRKVDVLIEDDKVALIRVEFARLEPFESLRSKVRVEGLEYVELTDDTSGHVLGYVYPERGMVLVLAGATDVTPTDTDRVEQMLLSPLDSQAFALRAERRPMSAASDNLADLQQAIELDATNAHALWLAAGVQLEIGQSQAAHESARKAVELAKDNSAYRLRLAETFIALGQYDQAVLATRDLLDDESIPDNTRAAAFFQMGRLASLGEADVADKAIGFYTTAIGLADKLASEGDMLERRAAKRLLVSAHLAIAYEVSRQDFENKVESVSQWVGRASGMAEEAIDNGDGGLEMRLEVASSSLAALVNIKPSRDPAPLVEEATKVLEAIRNESGDPLWLNEMEWRMGVAQTHALELWHHRRQMAEATKAYEAALGYFTRAAESRDQVPDTSTLVGRLYFHIGALHAVHRNDHRTAVKWYDKAEPLLSAERPTSALYVPRRDGEALVSMAVSYWDQDDYEHAVKLTESGAKLMEQAVASGVVEEKTLAVPYGNLSVMHKQLGNQAAALKFAKLADASKQVGTSAAGRPLPQQPSTTTPRPMAGGHPLPTGPSAPATSGVRTGVPAQRPQATTSGRTAMQQAAPTAVAPQEPRSASGRSKRPSASRTLLR